MLCEAAHYARRSSHPLRPYFQKLKAARGLAFIQGRRSVGSGPSQRPAGAG
jgi:hypothetical protein